MVEKFKNIKNIVLHYKKEYEHVCYHEKLLFYRKNGYTLEKLQKELEASDQHLGSCTLLEK